MLKFLLFSMILLIGVLVVTPAPQVSRASEVTSVEVKPVPVDGWPDKVPVPPGLKWYSPTRYAQRTVIQNGYDYHTPVHENTDAYFSNAPPSWNPNRIFPWRNSAGLDYRVPGWTSRTGIALPEGKSIMVWTEYIEAGASRPLPRISWQFPPGTVTVDLLSYRGQPFEVRTRTKDERGTWRPRTLWEGGTPPPGYRGPVHKCAACHDRAGAWESYGTMIRGSDTVFSFPVLEEGTLRPRQDLPVRVVTRP